MASSYYPAPSDTIDLLVVAARKAAEECSSDHPEDIANAMLNAIEGAVVVILPAYRKFGLDKQDSTVVD